MYRALQYMLALVLYCGACPMGLMGQVEAGPASRWGFAHVAGGNYAEPFTALLPADIERLANNSPLLSSMPEGYLFNNHPGSVPEPGAGSVGVFAGGISLFPFMRQRSGPELRLGLFATAPLNMRASYDRVARVPIDTLASAHTGAIYLIDSMHWGHYQISFQYRILAVQAALIWRMPTRFSLYGGIGMGAGLIHNTRTEIHHTAGHFFSPGYGPPDGRPASGREQEAAEWHPDGTGLWLQWHIPLGVDFLLHRMHPFWRRIHLFSEVDPQLRHAKLSHTGAVWDIGSLHYLGLRVEL